MRTTGTGTAYTWTATDEELAVTSGDDALDGPNPGRRVLSREFAGQKTIDCMPAGCHCNGALFSVQDGKISPRARDE